MLGAVALAGRLDEADRARDRVGRIVLEAVGEREVEEHLGVGRPLDLGVERRIDLEREVALHLVEVADVAVVHPEPAPVAERVAVGLLHR